MTVGAGILSQEALQTAGKLSRPNALWDKDEGGVFLLNKIYEDYIREKVHEQLIGMAKRECWRMTFFRLKRLRSIPVWSWQKQRICKI